MNADQPDLPATSRRDNAGGDATLAVAPGTAPTLMRELAQFKAALDAHAIVAITDASGRITYVNDKFCAISKWSREELIGRDHRIINSGHHSKAFFRDLWDTIRSGRIWRGELKNLAKDGTIYWVDSTIVPFLDTDGTPIQYIAIRAEITSRKLLEEHNVEMLRELNAANRELKDFSYIVSHDLKAPLRGISSLANWLAADYADKLGSEGKHKLDMIVSRAQRLEALVNGILAYSRAGASHKIHPLVDLDKLLRNTIEILAPPPHITVDIATSLPYIAIDPFKAQQVFQNLLSNAIKFMDKPAGRVVVSCADEGGYWHFCVTDNGPGIDRKYSDKVFQLFQTLSPQAKTDSTGIGLALAKKIIELEGGKIWIESSLGTGAAFHFTLPYSNPTDQH